MAKYKITIERWDDDDSVDTILTAPVTAEQAARFAPELLALTLGVEVEAPATGESVSEPRPKRGRRTKAEVEAARASAAEAMAAQPTAAQPEVTAPMNQTPAVDAPPAETPTTPAQPLAESGIVPGGYNPFIKS